MPQTKKIIAAAAVAVGILIGGYLWINNAQKADKQAAIDTFNAFSEAILELDILKAQGMARGEAYETLSLFAQLLDQADNLEIHPPEKPPVHEFIYADGELRVISAGGENLTVLRKTDGKWYVEEISSAISSSKTIKNEHGNILDRVETGNLPLTPEILDQVDEITNISEVESTSK